MKQFYQDIITSRDNAIFIYIWYSKFFQDFNSMTTVDFCRTNFMYWNIENDPIEVETSIYVYFIFLIYIFYIFVYYLRRIICQIFVQYIFLL